MPSSRGCVAQRIAGSHHRAAHRRRQGPAPLGGYLRGRPAGRPDSAEQRGVSIARASGFVSRRKRKAGSPSRRASIPRPTRRCSSASTSSRGRRRRRSERRSTTHGMPFELTPAMPARMESSHGFLEHLRIGALRLRWPPPTRFPRRRRRREGRYSRRHECRGPHGPRPGALLVELELGGFGTGAFDRSLALDPNDAFTHMVYSQLAARHGPAAAGSRRGPQVARARSHRAHD